MSTFADKVRAIVRTIPKGSVLTYKAVAVATGNPKAARAVANTMAKNFDESIPCHRVIRSDGSLGGYNRGGTAVKKQLLRDEGAVI
jgi:O-6-methylguanine DNA methyltransferase